MNDLDRLLALATQEPEHSTAFYRLLLQSEVYVLVLEGERVTAEGKIRFVMWRGEDGTHVVPIFSSRAAVRRALRKGWEALRLRGCVVLDGCRGTTVVLNPNEAYYCRLTSADIVNLLDTGSPDLPASAMPTTGDTIGLDDATDVPLGLRESLATLLAKHAGVERGYLLRRHRSGMEPSWLVALVSNVESLQAASKAVAGLAAKHHAARPVETIRLMPRSVIMADIERSISPFFVRDTQAIVGVTTLQ